jgi:hypothetical protein
MDSKNAGKEMLYAALSPRGIKPKVKEMPLGPRVSNLTGKVVYCISQYVGGSDIFIRKVADILPQYAPGVRAEYRKKPSAYLTDDPELWDETVKEADAFVYGCGA